MMHPIRWIKRKINDYLDYDRDEWERDYRDALTAEPEIVQVRPRWGAPDPHFDYLFQVEETRLMTRVDIHGHVTTQDVGTVVMSRVRAATEETEPMPHTGWVDQVLHEMDVEFRGRLLDPPFDYEHPVYSRRHSENVSTATREWRRFLETPLPEWDEDWEDYIRSGVSADMVRRALHASDNSPDTQMMPRILV